MAKDFTKVYDENARLREEVEGLKEVINKTLLVIKSLGAGGHGETPLLLLNPEKGDNALILATFMPHSGADVLLSLLQRECVKPLEQALKGE